MTKRNAIVTELNARVKTTAASMAKFSEDNVLQNLSSSKRARKLGTFFDGFFSGTGKKNNNNTKVAHSDRSVANCKNSFRNTTDLHF